MATCRSCGAEIEWATSETTGKAMPIDAGVSPKGNLAVVAGKVHVYGIEDMRLARDRRMSHFVTCPDAPNWRR